MRVALDSNVMIYAEGLTDDPRNAVAQNVLDGLPAGSLVIPLQAAAETLRWLIKRAKLPRKQAVRNVDRWVARYATQATDHIVLTSAFELVSSHNLQIFDAVILAAAAEARASVLLSEDMQEGFRWRGVTVANPFAAKPSTYIANILNPKE
jgi:predicted nucleic acid-binding protein